MDAAEYMEELKAEASALRAELARMGGEGGGGGGGGKGGAGSTALSLSSYVSSLPEAQLQVSAPAIYRTPPS